MFTKQPTGCAGEIGTGHVHNKKKKHKRRAPITYYELLEIEKRKSEQAEALKVKIKRNFPLAPDGFIPNSVVRKFFQLFDTPAKSDRKIWKLKWRPKDSLLEENEEMIEEEEYTDRGFYLDWSLDSTDNEEDERAGSENEVSSSAHDIMDKSFSQLDDSEIDQFKDLEKLLSHIYKSLSKFEWFVVTDMSVDNVIKQLTNQLIIRNSDNHSILTDYLIKILRKFKIHADLFHWLLAQLEEELDATSTDILRDNIKIIGVLGVETYNIDISLLKIISPASSQFPDLSELALSVQAKIARISKQQVYFVLDNYRKLQNVKYKRMKKFRLKEFINEIEAEIRASIAKKKRTGVDAENETESEVFTAMLKEDWIPVVVKGGLKTLRDFLVYLFKALRTLKAKRFYEKAAQYLHMLFGEFKLINTPWERQAVDHFIKTNQESTMPESLRLVDLEMLDKYYSMSEDKLIKDEILVEFLRSASLEKTRPQVKKLAKTLLEKYNTASNVNVGQLIEFFESHKSVMPKYSENIAYYQKNKGNVISKPAPKERGHSPSVNKTDHQVESSKENETVKNKYKDHDDDNSVKLTGSFTESKTDKSEDPVENKIKVEITQLTNGEESDEAANNNNTERTTGDNEGQEFMGERSDVEKEPSSELGSTSPTVIMKRKNRNDQGGSEANKTPRETSYLDEEMLSSTAGGGDDEKKQIGIEVKIRRKSRFNLLPNKVRTWNYFKNRNERERVTEENTRHDEIKERVIHALERIKADLLDDLTEDQRRELERDLREVYSRGLVNDSDYDYGLIDSDSASERGVREDRETANSARSQDILEGIKRRILFDEMKLNGYNKPSLVNLDSLPALNTGEKGHFINTIIRGDNGIRLSNYKQGHEIDYTQLIECLIIRGLELHKHYEKLLPAASALKYQSTTQFITVPFYSDFLIVKRYQLRKKFIMPQQYQDQRYRAREEHERLMQAIRSKHKTQVFYPKMTTNLNLRQQTCPQINVSGRNPAATRQNTTQIGSPEFVDTEINHLHLIEKLLNSYGAINLEQIHSILGKTLPEFVNKLHSKIPNRIVPLIWNDPVIQKLALIISTSNHIKHNSSHTTSKPSNRTQFRNHESQFGSLRGVGNSSRSYHDLAQSRNLAQNDKRYELVVLKPILGKRTKSEMPILKYSQYSERGKVDSV